MGNCLILKHGFIKTKFGIITPSLVKQQQTTTISFTASEDALYVVSSNINGSTQITSISVRDKNSIKYSSIGDTSVTGGCAIIDLKKDEACSVNVSKSSACIVAKLPIKGADVKLIGKNVKNSTATNFDSNIVTTNGQKGGLYLGVSNGGKNTGYIYSVYTKTNCDGDKLTYSASWDINTIGTFIPNNDSNTFTIGTSLNDPQSQGGRQTSTWLFKVIQKNIV